jgi:hypothetical protein
MYAKRVISNELLQKLQQESKYLCARKSLALDLIQNNRSIVRIFLDLHTAGGITLANEFFLANLNGIIDECTDRGIGFGADIRI